MSAYTKDDLKADLAQGVRERVTDAELWQWVLENSTRLSEPMVNAATHAPSGESLCHFTFRLPTTSLFHANPREAIAAAIVATPTPEVSDAAR